MISQWCDKMWITQEVDLLTKFDLTRGIFKGIDRYVEMNFVWKDLYALHV